MKKRIQILIMALSMLFSLCACGNSSIDSSANDNQNSGTWTNREIADISFKTPDSWSESGSTNETLYFYPDNAMLMVSYDEGTINLDDLEIQTELLNGLAEGFESFKIKNQEVVSVSSQDGLRVNAAVVMASEKYNSDILLFNSGSGMACFMIAIKENTNDDYAEEFTKIIDSIKVESATSGTSSNETADLSELVEITATPTLDGTVCVFIKNNSDVIIDELETRILYKDNAGTTVDTNKDGHDMILPGYTVVSRMDAPDNYEDFEVITSYDLGVHPKYENHSKSIAMKSNEGEGGIIIEITNNSDVTIEELEYIVVLYKGEDIAAVKYPHDVRDIIPSDTITEKESTYSTEYDRFEVYINQAHTFGL